MGVRLTARGSVGGNRRSTRAGLGMARVDSSKGRMTDARDEGVDMAWSE